MDSTRQTEDTAAHWLARRELEDWTVDDQAQLDVWLDAAILNRVAFLRLETAWEQTRRLPALAPGAGRRSVPPRDGWNVSPFFERRQGEALPAARFRQPLTWAAALLPAALLAGWYLWPGDRTFETPIGATASIPLQDGSNVTLNTASRIRIALDDRERRIELRSGEAFFDVAKDPTRPFIVEAGARRIVAVGTKFSVRRDGSAVSVIVTEGAVRFDADDAGLLEAGAVAQTRGDEVAVVSKTVREAEEALSWRTGYLTFDETALGEVVAEFNRYTPRPIRIGSARLEDLRITGRFRATNTDAFIRVVEQGFRVEVEAGEKEIILR